MEKIAYGKRQESIADAAKQSGNDNIAIMHYGLAIDSYMSIGDIDGAISVAEKVGDKSVIKKLYGWREIRDLDPKRIDKAISIVKANKDIKALEKLIELKAQQKRLKDLESNL